MALLSVPCTHFEIFLYIERDFSVALENVVP